MLRITKLLSLITIFVLILFNLSIGSVHPSYSELVPVDTMPFYPDANYDQSIPHPNEHLDEPVGFWPLRYHELENYLKIISESSDRVKYEVCGKTHEGRSLYNVFIGNEQNISRLDEIKQMINKLADPGRVKTQAELDEIVNNYPAVAWLGYSIHGDEVSGVDASIQLIYHLAAGNDARTKNLLDNVLIIIQPSENPDGRERYLSMLETYRSQTPNYDRRSQQHSGVWPYGRGNHYLFDLNRDWILATQLETQSRLKTIVEWQPQLVIDAHEMGSNATYLFTPPRQPINYNTPDNVLKWWDKFQTDQGHAFDKRGWPYYVKEWHEQWYPGYGSAWPTFFGTIGILYEQAGVDGTFVKQSNDYLLTYHESVNHQFTSCLTNLFTLAENKTQIMRDFHDARKKIVDDGLQNKLSFLVIPDNDELKIDRFIKSIAIQGIEVERAISSFTVNSSEDIFKRSYKSKQFPEGTYIIRTSQPHGALAKAVLEFDPHLKLEFLKEERRELEKFNDTKMYETSTWSVPLAYNLDAYQTNSPISVKTEKVTGHKLTGGNLINPEAAFAFVINMVGEKTYQAMNRIFALNITAYASQKPFAVEGYEFNAGSIVIRIRGNADDLVEKLTGISNEIEIDIVGINTAITTKGSYLGADTFHLLKQPRLAILTGSPLGTSSFGSLWFTLDKELGIPHSLIDFNSISNRNLSEYNVIVMPSGWGSLSRSLGRGGAENLRDWISNGGTLITVGNASVWAADSSSGISQVRLKRQVLDRLSDYDKELLREINAESPEVDTMAIYHPEKVTLKEEGKDGEKAPEGKKDKEDLDEWQRRFAPSGVYLKAVLDMDEWLTFGMRNEVPVSVYTSYAFMAEKPVTTVGRFTNEKNELRLSGLLWPEAAERWTATAYLTRESIGRGQLIMFATHPNGRAYHYGTRKMFINAVLYGPGMGSSFDGPYEND